MRLLQAVLREPFLQDETFVQDQPKKSFFGGPFTKTLHRQYSHREGIITAAAGGRRVFGLLMITHYYEAVFGIIRFWHYYEAGFVIYQYNLLNVYL